MPDVTEDRFLTLINLNKSYMVNDYTDWTLQLQKDCSGYSVEDGQMDYNEAEGEGKTIKTEGITTVLKKEKKRP